MCRAFTPCTLGGRPSSHSGASAAHAARCSGGKQSDLVGLPLLVAVYSVDETTLEAVRRPSAEICPNSGQEYPLRHRWRRSRFGVTNATRQCSRPGSIIVIFASLHHPLAFGEARVRDWIMPLVSRVTTTSLNPLTVLAAGISKKA